MQCNSCRRHRLSSNTTPLTPAARVSHDTFLSLGERLNSPLLPRRGKVNSKEVEFLVDGQAIPGLPGNSSRQSRVRTTVEVTVLHIVTSGFSDIPERFAPESTDRIKETMADARALELAESERIVVPCHGLASPPKKPSRGAAPCEHLPIYKKAMELTIYFEKIVRNFSRSGDLAG
jgi:hypothetical protein